MREIKFRSWDKTYKRFYYFKLEQSGYENTANPNEPIGLTTEWMQYTGLKDKNGKEIYEGDIIRFYYCDESRESRVEWMESTHGGWIFKTLDDKEALMYSDDLEVIGNIYATPELKAK